LRRCALWVVLLTVVSPGLASVFAAVVVEVVKPGYGAEKAGILPGDILQGWYRPPSPPLHPEAIGGTLRTPFDVNWVAREQAPRGDVWFEGERAGESFRWRIADGDLQFQTRPSLSPTELALYQQGLRSVSGEGGRPDPAPFRRLAADREQAGDPEVALWFLQRLASVNTEGGFPDEAQAVWWEAIHAADAAGLDGVGVKLRLYFAEERIHRAEFTTAAKILQEAVAIQEARQGEELTLAFVLGWAMHAAWGLGDTVTAEAVIQRADAIYRRLAPRSLEASMNLSNQGMLADARGDFRRSEQALRAALAIQEPLDPHPLVLARTWANLAVTLSLSREYELADEFFAKAHAAFEQTVPDSLALLGSFVNRSELALMRDDLTAADQYSRSALHTARSIATGTTFEATVFSLRARIALAQGDTQTAETYARRGLALWRDLAPQGPDALQALEQVAQVTQAQGRMAEAEVLYRQAVRWLEDRMPEAHCQSCYRLGVLLRDSGRRREAQQYFRRAIDTLEGQGERLAASPEARAQFAAEFASHYRDFLSLLVEDGEPEAAFHILERYRARSFLSFLAERSASLKADIPAEVERERLQANAEHDRVLGELAQGGRGADEEAHLRRELHAARRRQDDVAARIRSLAPRVAALRYPRPMNLRQVQETLDPDTLLLSYSVGPSSGYLFALGPEEDAFEVVPVAIGESDLRQAVKDFRAVIERGRVDPRTAQVLTASRRLSGLLLAPVAPEIARARRLLILPDGPLHSLPFGALADPTERSRHRYLAETRPIALAASATVFALNREQRRPTREFALVAFGDPRYPGADRLADGEPARSRAVRDGLSLAPLPATREEVVQLQQLFPQARIYLGPMATEERAKTESRDATFLHFACHGFLNQQFPLESGLALSLPSAWRPGQENGLLQGWEIIEQMRIHAELVTLSACDTGLGKVLGGEGLVGLSSAFLYAGARTVLATLWGVDDHSTGQLMGNFYGHLRDGQDKAQALHRAQIDLIHNQAFAHPFHWAGFELLGDWY